MESIWLASKCLVIKFTSALLLWRFEAEIPKRIARSWSCAVENGSTSESRYFSISAGDILFKRSSVPSGKGCVEGLGTLVALFCPDKSKRGSAIVSSISESGKERNSFARSSSWFAISCVFICDFLYYSGDKFVNNTLKICGLLLCILMCPRQIAISKDRKVHLCRSRDTITICDVICEDCR